MTYDAYRPLAAALDALPNGYPPTESGVELELLACLFTPEEAAVAAQLGAEPETVPTLAGRTGTEPGALRLLLKGLAKRGLITVEKADGGLGYALMPFIVGFFEMQLPRLDEKLARLVEAYFHEAFKHMLPIEPQFHRVLPIGETIPTGIDIQPYESASSLLNEAQAWGVIDCICRKQRALAGHACEHPIEACMIFSSTPGAFDHADDVRVLTREEALALLRTLADAGLVHTVGNQQDDSGYICNCCTCGCGILRGVKELGMSNVVARAAFVSTVDPALCISCEDCVDYCPFEALALGDDGIMSVDRRRCVGCGQCIMHCEQSALHLERRPDEEVLPVPATMHDWRSARQAARGI